MSITAAMEEAYAYARVAETIFETLEIDHITFPEPVRIVTGVSEDMQFRLVAGGELVTFQACQVTFTPPGSSESGPTPAKCRIDAVSGLLRPYLKDAVQASQALTVTYRAYTSADLDQPGDVIGGLDLWDAVLTAQSAEGTLKLREVELQAFPLATYDQTYYPTLQDT